MTLLVSEEVDKGLKLIKGGFYTLESLEKAIDNKGGGLHLDTKVVFEQLTKEEIITALFYGYEVKTEKVKINDLNKYFTIKRSTGSVYHIIIVENKAFVAHNESYSSAEYSVNKVLEYINDGRWVIQ